MKLTDVKYIRQLMTENGISFQKKFGQNFLINEAIPKRIASYISKGENVLEIGPGIGVLTRELCEAAKKVIAVEIDNGLIPILDITLADFSNIKVIHADVMTLDLPRLIAEEFAGQTVSVCANLPYNITTPVIMKLFESGVRFAGITVMIQKEVADRFCATPGTPEYGAVTAAVAYYAKTEKLFNVSPGNFLPAPKVDSTVMRFIPYEAPPVDVCDVRLFFDIIAAAFGQRRKTLSNALSSYFSNIEKTAIIDAIARCNLPSDIRGERLSIGDFARLSNQLCKKMK